ASDFLILKVVKGIQGGLKSSFDVTDGKFSHAIYFLGYNKDNFMNMKGRAYSMYLTITEISDYLSMDELKVKSLVLQGRIRAVHDGEQYLINKEQFNTHFDQVEKYRKMIQDYLNEPISEDIDVKDGLKWN